MFIVQRIQKKKVLIINRFDAVYLNIFNYSYFVVCVYSLYLHFITLHIHTLIIVKKRMCFSSLYSPPPKKFLTIDQGQRKLDLPWVAKYLRSALDMRRQWSWSYSQDQTRSVDSTRIVAADNHRYFSPLCHESNRWLCVS